MLRIQNNNLIEDAYDIASEAKNASIFGIGNGYFGIRGSFEEFGDVFVQGTYVRGVFDSIIEIPQTYSTNTYMKNYYFDEQKLKEFEYEDSCINICDFTAYRIFIDGELYLPWKYKICSYIRYIDYETGGLIRKLVIEDAKGNQTKLEFFKVASFKDNHLFVQELKITKLNHNLNVVVKSGVDVLVKTNGQKKSTLEKLNYDNDVTILNLSFGKKYNMFGEVCFKDEVSNADFVERNKENLVYGNVYKMTKNEAIFRKIVSFYANIDDDYELRERNNLHDKEYFEILNESNDNFKEIFKRVDIKIHGNDKLDAYLRYANYQTLIGFDRYSSVHSLSAKNLTSEKYNQFVWWDCEIYQMPFFLATFPDQVKGLLMYRYKCLDQARKNAKKEHCEGAKFAFCSSVKGDENVWIYAKHPFLQIHINSDVAYGIINYYKHTADKDFLIEYGFEMIEEIIKYFISRSTLIDNQYHLNNVTGTDEHHDYVNNDAYTNIILKYVLDESLRLMNEMHYNPSKIELNLIKEFRDKLYIPKFINKILPQFDGYLDLSPELIKEGDSKITSTFQMKESGLYHLSQLIKQPDVLLLYAYVNIEFNENYKENYKFYLEKCEASSSLTYPCHAINAIDNDDNEEFYKNLYSSLKIDIDDLHGGAHQGVHAASLAGGYYSFYRGVLGVKANENYFEINPHKAECLDSFDMEFYHNYKLIKVHYHKDYVDLESDSLFQLKYKNKIINTNKVTLKFTEDI